MPEMSGTTGMTSGVPNTFGNMPDGMPSNVSSGFGAMPGVPSMAPGMPSNVPSGFGAMPGVPSMAPGMPSNVPSGFGAMPGVPSMAPGMPPEPQFQPTGVPGTMQAATPIVGYTATGQPMVQQVVAAPAPKRDMSGLFKTIAIVCLSLVSVTFIGLFVWMNMQYNETKSDVDSKISAKVNEAVDDNTMKLELEFAEREKYPFSTFTGPEDYGALSFQYPKTWSVYVAADALQGGDYQAYFNPIEVPPVSNNNINALRVSVLNSSYDEVVATYQRYMERQEYNLTVESVTIGADNNIVANRYTGTIPESILSGYIVIFKIRDKTAVVQTDSVVFEADYNTLLSTIRFNA